MIIHWLSRVEFGSIHNTSVKCVCYQCSQMLSVLQDTLMVESLVSLPLLLWPSLKTTLTSIKTNYNKQCLPIISALENSWQQYQNFEAGIDSKLKDSFTYIERSCLQITRICEHNSVVEGLFERPWIFGSPDPAGTVYQWSHDAEELGKQTGYLGHRRLCWRTVHLLVLTGLAYIAWMDGGEGWRGEGWAKEQEMLWIGNVPDLHMPTGERAGNC